MNIITFFVWFYILGNEFDINVGLKKKRRKRENVIDNKWREVGFYLRTLPKIIKKVQSRDPAFLRSLEDEEHQVEINRQSSPKYESDKIQSHDSLMRKNHPTFRGFEENYGNV